jgi:Chaperone of endosialidase
MKHLGPIEALGRVSSGASFSSFNGYTTTSFVVNSRNPIWRFENADGYGLSYFQGTASRGGQDSLGIHFGTPTDAGSSTVFTPNGTETKKATVVGTQGNVVIQGNGWVNPGPSNGSITLDSSGYKTMMIIGPNIAGNAGKGRQVDVWDFLKVNGDAAATGEVWCYYSDQRLKTNIEPIKNALLALQTWSAVSYKPNALGISLGFKDKKEVGLLAQQVQKNVPEAVGPCPADNEYLTIRYEKLVPHLVAALQELSLVVHRQGLVIEELKAKVG